MFDLRPGKAIGYFPLAAASSSFSLRRGPPFVLAAAGRVHCSEGPLAHVRYRLASHERQGQSVQPPRERER